MNSISYFPTIVDGSQNYSEIKVENLQPDDSDPLKITNNTGINYDVYNQPLNPQNCILFKELKGNFFLNHYSSFHNRNFLF